MKRVCCDDILLKQRAADDLYTIIIDQPEKNEIYLYCNLLKRNNSFT